MIDEQTIREMFERDKTYFKNFMIEHPLDLKISHECIAVLHYIEDSIVELNIQPLEDVKRR